MYCTTLQDVSGGLPVQVTNPITGEQDLPLYGMQIDLEQARAELKNAVAGGGTAGPCMLIGSKFCHCYCCYLSFEREQSEWILIIYDGTLHNR